MPLQTIVHARQHARPIRRGQKARALLIQIPPFASTRNQRTSSIRSQGRHIMLRETTTFTLPLLRIISRHIDDLRHAPRTRRQTTRSASGLVRAVGENERREKKESFHKVPILPSLFYSSSFYSRTRCLRSWPCRGADHGLQGVAYLGEFKEVHLGLIADKFWRTLRNTAESILCALSVSAVHHESTSFSSTASLASRRGAYGVAHLEAGE